MDSSVSVSFRYAQRDYTRATRANFGSRRRLMFDVAVAAVVAAAGLYLLTSRSDKWMGILLLSLSLIFVLVLIVGLAVVPRMVFRSTPKLHDEYFLEFSPQGIHFHTAQIDSELQWSTYSRALINAHSYLLYYGPRSHTIVPRRVFQNDEQRNAFEHLLAQKIPQIVRRMA